MNPTLVTIDGDWSEKLEIGHWVLSHNSGHTHGSKQIAGQNLTQHFGPVTLTETFVNGVGSVSASAALGPFNLPLGHFDLTKPGVHPIKVEVDSGNWFRGTLSVQ